MVQVEQELELEVALPVSTFLTIWTGLCSFLSCSAEEFFFLKTGDSSTETKDCHEHMGEVSNPLPHLPWRTALPPVKVGLGAPGGPHPGWDDGILATQASFASGCHFISENYYTVKVHVMI